MRLKRFMPMVVLITIVSVLSVQAQMSSGSYSLSGGNFVSVGGSSSSSTASITGGVSGGATGVSSSSSYSVGSGAAAVSFVLSATYSGLLLETVPVAERTLMVYVPGSAGQATGTFYFREGGRTTYQAVTMTAGSDDTLRYVLPESDLTIRGLEYYFEVSLSGLSSEVGSESEPLAFVTSLTEAQGQRPTPLPAASFRIVGLPLELGGGGSVDSVFGDDLGAPDPKQWRLGRYTSDGDSILVYTDAPNVTPGKGYWLITREGKGYGEAGISVRPNANDTSSISGDLWRYYRVPLDTGWNQLANPFPFEINWNEVIYDDGGTVKRWDTSLLEDTIYAYDGSAYTSGRFVPAWEGMFVYVRKPGLQAMFRYREVPGSSKLAAPPVVTSIVPGWRLELTLESDGRYDRGNFIGVHPDASTTADYLDYFEPPRAPDAPRLAFRLPGEDRHLRRTDLRSIFIDGATWNLLLSENLNRKLEISGIEDLPEGFQAWMIYDAGTTVQVGSDMTVDLPNDVMQIQLVVGSQSYVAGAASAVLPREFALKQNFPNPFNPATAIRFDLPAASHVELELFNLLGQKVRTLVSGDFQAGHQLVEWDGTSDGGNRVASGVYFYRLTAGSFTATKKMILLK